MNEVENMVNNQTLLKRRLKSMWNVTPKTFCNIAKGLEVSDNELQAYVIGCEGVKIKNVRKLAELTVSPPVVY